MTALEDERAAHWVCVKMRDDALAEVARLRAALKDMIEISTRNSEASLMLIAIRRCAEHALNEQVKTAGED